MRISTSMLHRLGIERILERQDALLRTQQQLSSGRRILTPSDDPSGSARLVDITDAIARTGQLQRNTTAAQVRLESEEGALRSVTDVLHRVRELVVQGNNDTYSDVDRTALVIELRQLQDQLLGIANTRDPQGDALFGGFQTGGEPFVVGPGGVVYLGDQGQRMAQIGPGRQVATGDSGFDVFMAVASGNGTFRTAADTANSGSGVIGPGGVTDPALWVADSYTIRFTAPDAWEVTDSGGATVGSGGFAPGQAVTFAGVQVTIDGQPAAGDSFTVSPATRGDLFATLQAAADALAEGDPVVRHNGVASALSDLDRSLDHVLNLRAAVGGRLNAIDAQRQSNESAEYRLRGVSAELGEVDLAETIGRMQQQLAGLQAAQQGYLRLQNLSLFKYL